MQLATLTMALTDLVRVFRGCAVGTLNTLVLTDFRDEVESRIAQYQIDEDINAAYLWLM